MHNVQRMKGFVIEFLLLRRHCLIIACGMVEVFLLPGHRESLG